MLFFCLFVWTVRAVSSIVWALSRQLKKNATFVSEYSIACLLEMHWCQLMSNNFYKHQWHQSCMYPVWWHWLPTFSSVQQDLKYRYTLCCTVSAFQFLPNPNQINYQILKNDTWYLNVIWIIITHINWLQTFNAYSLPSFRSCATNTNANPPTQIYNTTVFLALTHRQLLFRCLRFSIIAEFARVTNACIIFSDKQWPTGRLTVVHFAHWMFRPLAVHCTDTLLQNSTVYNNYKQ